MKIPLVDLQAQYAAIKDEVNEVVQDVMSRSAFIGGDYLKNFEESFAAFCHARFCVGVGNGTDALCIALKGLGIGPGDEVIVPANTFVATSEAVTMAGAKVVFADVLPDTYNIDPERVAEKINPRTKAIIPVHLYGQPADMDPVLELARSHGLKVIEDAAQAHGAEYKGRRIGSMGDAACFSFYPGKNLGAYGDAGAIVTNDEGLAVEMRMYANHGRVDKYDHKIEGVNSRLDGLQAAVLGVKLRHLEDWTESRRRVARHYNELLAGSRVVTPVELPEVRAVYHLYVVRLPHVSRDEVKDELAQRQIFAGIHYPIALPDLKAYRHLSKEERNAPVSSKAAGQILSLPVYAELQPRQVEHVASNLLEIGKALDTLKVGV